jgi:hypothetical protein
MKRLAALPALVVLVLAVLACRAFPLTPTRSPAPGPNSSALPALTVLPATLTPSAVPIPGLVDQVISEKNTLGQYVIEGKIPQIAENDLRAGAFNRAVHALLDPDLEAFRKSAVEAASIDLPDSSSFYQLSYQLAYDQDDLISLLITADTYIKGAAHPGQTTFSLTYDLTSTRPIELHELFRPGAAYLQLLSKICLVDLQKRDFPVSAEGVSPRDENFRTWNLTGQGLRIHFDPYQVAAYAAGPQEVIIPYSDLAGLLDPAGPLGKFAHE